MVSYALPVEVQGGIFYLSTEILFALVGTSEFARDFLSLNSWLLVSNFSEFFQRVCSSDAARRSTPENNCLTLNFCCCWCEVLYEFINVKGKVWFFCLRPFFENVMHIFSYRVHETKLWNFSSKFWNSVNDWTETTGYVSPNNFTKLTFFQ